MVNPISRESHFITSASSHILHLQELIQNHFLERPNPKDLQLVTAHIDHALYLLHHQKGEPGLMRRLETCKKMCHTYLNFHYEGDPQAITQARAELLQVIHHL